MQRLALAVFVALIASLQIISLPVSAQTLKGSRASMERQNQIAIKHGYTFIKTSSVVAGLVTSGDLVEVRNSSNFELHNVSYPFVRPPVKAFIERLSSQYRVACGEKLTVTSLTRPIDRQPANASSDSVHPTGMAVDLRIPSKQSCRTWLENYLLAMEGDDVLDVTRERRPPHYHVAVFPDTYEQYVANLSTSTEEYTVRRGDTLSRIASITGTSVAHLRSFNGLHNDTLQVGQKLLVRAAGASPTDTSNAVAAVAAAPAASFSAAPAGTAITEQATAVTVRRGDTLSRIATKTGTSVDQLRALNGLRSDMLQVGQKLLLRQPSTTTPTDALEAAIAAVTPGLAGQEAAASSAAASITNQVTTVTVRRGDTLSRIATKTGTSVEQLRAINGLRSDMLQVGQKLLLHPTATTAAAATSIVPISSAQGVLAVTTASTASTPNNQVAAVTVSTHRVKRGETLWRIARRYGTTADALVAKNGLASDILQVGQTLTVK